MPKPRRHRAHLDARPDPIDFRDQMYVPTLVEVPSVRPLATYRRARVPILDQGQEGACTGFGLATVANFLLRTRRVIPEKAGVSPRMLYEMAKRYDEWPGTRYSGSSARGAVKGWQKHGVCSERLWPYFSRDKAGSTTLTDPRARNAALRPLGAYFRVNHRDIVAMHAAMTEAGILYATAEVHSGWDRVPASGDIPLDRHPEIEGGHAFALVAYDERGFWLQNSWGPHWGRDGYARVSYDDWLQHGTDVWVARLGAPIELLNAQSQAVARSELAGRTETFTQADLRPHIISVGNDGTLRPSGPFGTTPEHLNEIFTRDFPTITKGWKKKRLLLYAHGGLVSEQSAVQRVADYRQALLDAQVYPLSFVWKTDYWTTLTNMLEDAISRRRPEGFVGKAKDFLLDRLDDGLEQLARLLTGKAEWDEMKENAELATTSATGAFRLAVPLIQALAQAGVEVHVAGHSAGSVFMAWPVQLLAASGVTIKTCTLWAPACTTALFKKCYLPAIQAGRLGHVSIFTLTDKAERDDNCAGIYHKSLLFLVSNAFEEKAHIPLPGKMGRPGEPLLGMERFVGQDAELTAIFKPGDNWILSPNTEPIGSPLASRSAHHGDFDDDEATVKATLARILGNGTGAGPITFVQSASSAQSERRHALGEMA